VALIVADTDVLIDYLAGREPMAGRIAVELATSTVGTTAITRSELLASAKTDRQRGLLQTLLNAIPALSLDTPSADCAANLRRQLEARGEGIGMADSLLAGIVLANDAILLTRNRRHFERVPGLKLSTPQQA
jgi:tRNA(fMet)-specific endonuclease VapC